MSISVDDALAGVRRGWEERRLASATVLQREQTLAILEETASELGGAGANVTEELIATAARRVRARYGHAPSQGCYLFPLKEMSLLCGITCEELVSGPFGPPRRTAVPERFAEAHAAYLEHMELAGLAPETKRRREACSRAFLDFLGGRLESLEEMGEEDVSGFLAEKSKTHSASSVRNLRGIVKDLLVFLISHHGVPEEAAAFLFERSKTPPQAPQTFLSSDEVSRLLEAAANASGHPKRTLAWVSVLIQYAVRAEDVVGLKIGDVDWAENRITFAYDKTGSPQTFPLTEGVRYVLLDYMKCERPMLASCPYMFPTTKHPVGKLPNGNSLTAKLHVLADAAGVEVRGRFGCHTLRRSSATALMEGGLPYPDISRYLNHFQSGTALSGVSMRYLRAHPSRLRTAALEVPDEV